MNKAIISALGARKEWDLRPIQDRAEVFFKAADILSGPRRAEILAKTMIGQVSRCVAGSDHIRGHSPAEGRKPAHGGGGPGEIKKYTAIVLEAPLGGI